MAVDNVKIVDFQVKGESVNALEQEDLIRLARLLEKYAPHDDSFELKYQGLKVVKSSTAADDQTYMLSEPGICIVPQGSKAVSYAQNGFEYDESKMVVYAAHVPISVRITKASPEQPYLCLVIPLEPEHLRDLIMKVFPHGVPKTDQAHAVYVGNANPKIVKSAVRLMELIEQQEECDLLVPLVIDEILIRLLRSPAGIAIAQIGMTDSHVEKVSKAIAWLKDNYVKPVKIEDLASMAGMSVSAFHIHFKAFTSMSPLQFQKTMRLQQARHLIRINQMDVSNAAFEVGYVSASQFSREYSRYFGVSPSKETAS